MESRLDIVIYGATGFTGKKTLPEIYKLSKAKGRNLTWGIAGRSEKKLQNVLSATAKSVGVADLSSIAVIIADSNDEESIKRMTAQAKVIINLCGPYTLHGEVVVKSCVETGTHYVDASGEAMFIEDMQLKYHKAAEDKGIYIVSACGAISIPIDLGLVFLENSFNGTLNSVETYVHYYSEGFSRSKARYHYTSWESGIRGLHDTFKFLAIRKQLFRKPLPKCQPQLYLRLLPFRKHSLWPLPYFVMDKDVVLRSQGYFYEHERKRPVQVNCYALVDSFAIVLLVTLFSFIVFILSQFEFGTKLLLRYPEFFTAGAFSHEDPSETALELERFSYTLEGVGWGEKLAEGEDQHKTKPNKAIVGRVSGVNPGYGFTCVAITLCAIVILTEPKNLPARGGVYTTAAAFSKTSLIEQLQENDARFEIISVKDL